MRRRKVFLVLIPLLILCTISAITYASYKAGSKGRGSAGISKWDVALKSGDNELSNDFDVGLIQPDTPSAIIGSNMIAPGYSGKAELLLDFTNTEVSVDYNVTIGSSSLDRLIGSSDISVNVYSEDSSGVRSNIIFGKDVTVPIVNRSKFTDDNGKVKLVFDFMWNSDSSTDVADTLIGCSKEYLSLPVHVVVKQHISDTTGGSENTTSILTQNISYAETDESQARETEPLIYTFSEQDVLSKNPERGFYSSSSIGLNEDGLVLPPGYWHAITESTTSSILYLKCDLSAFSGNMNGDVDKPLTDAAVAAFDSIISEIKQNNNTVILRFVYDNNATSIISGKSKIEPEQGMLLTHIAQLGPTFKKYQSTINLIQVGFYGLWGESFYNTDVNSHPEYYKQITEALLNATDGTDIMIALRTPSYYASYREIDISNIHNDITTKDEGAYRVGVFNDGYGGSTTDLGTYVNRDKETQWLSNQASHTYYGGEAVVDSNYSDNDPWSAINNVNTGSNFINEAFKVHTSYLNWEWNQALHRQWALQDYTGNESAYEGTKMLTYIENHLGYRFVVKEVKTYETAESGKVLPLDITIKNVGFGNMVRKKRADIILTDSSDNVITQYSDISFDVRDFISQAQIKKTVKIQLPELSAGTYKLYLRVSKGEVLQNGKYYGAIRFANDGMWNEDLEANYIAKFTI